MKKVLILGSGGLQIGQAGEFDYSGSQAIKALKEEGIASILINPNIATVQTDGDMAKRTYFLPVTDYFAAKVIKREKPDGILLGFGGQTALNVGLSLDAKGILTKYGVKVLGTPMHAIRDTEDRGLFIERLQTFGAKTAKSAIARSVKEGITIAEELGYPIMLRAGFSLGGANSGVVRDQSALVEKLGEVLRETPHILLEEYLEGWKEIEYEIVRDRFDNCIAVCNMENIDPMGIHTGDSIVVSPSQTLTNYEYHMLRETALKTVRHLGIVGECNIQYALNPETSDYRVIEINARLSRSSALASKATGYPLAFVATKLALGYGLTDLQNSVTKMTQACFEPALDYLVLKVPRWDLTKFYMASRDINSEMKSVGEVMAIGRSFEEVLQKALRMLAIGVDGLVAHANGNFKVPSYRKEIIHATDRRIFAIAQALKEGVSVKTIHRLSFIDRWFLEKMKNIVDMAAYIRKHALTPVVLERAKQYGFSDRQLGTLTRSSEASIRDLRLRFNVRPMIKQIDTLAGEFPAKTNYLYLTYHGKTHDVVPDKGAMMVLGSGPYAIGSSVEFDWCGVQAIKTLKKEGFQTVMINYNPETVSTDYDIATRLYFDELTFERVLDICDLEKPKGVVVSTGGQIPNNLSLKLHEAKIKVLGTSSLSIDRAEDRHKFSALLDTLRVDQPPWIEATDIKRAKATAKDFGYPVLIRPSYILSGTAMNVVFDETALDRHLRQAFDISPEHPVVISKFIEDAREIEIDGVAQGGALVIYAITEHVENAGTHSGDATIVTPPQRTYLETVRLAKRVAKSIIKSLKVTGPFNIQFLAKENQLKVIESNLRASRSFPFVSKATKYNFIEIAINAMLGKKIKGNYQTLDLDYVVVKSPQFSYHRIKDTDPVASVEMNSTGEVASFGGTFSEALLKSMLSVQFRMPRKNILLAVGGEANKIKMLPQFIKLKVMGFSLFATEHTADFLLSHGISSKRVHKLSTSQKPNVSDLLMNGKLDLIINIPAHFLKRERDDDFIIRRRAIDLHIPLISNLSMARAFINAMDSCRPGELKIKAWDEY